MRRALRPRPALVNSIYVYVYDYVYVIYGDLWCFAVICGDL